MRATSWGAALLVGAAGLMVGCENEREPLGTPACPTWKRNVADLMERSCVECHGPDLAEGNYRLDDYLEAFGTGTDKTPNIQARYPQSTLLTIFEADEVHAALATDTKATLDRWVVECSAQFTVTSIHEPGILDPFSDDFHVNLIRETDYDFAECAECHGEDFGGGSSEASCLTCHEQGPKDCSTCHAGIAELNAHGIHTDGGMLLEKEYECEVCHIVPEAFEDEGHVFLASGELDPPPAEVVFSGPAEIPDGPAPVYSESNQSCSNTYCHSANPDDDQAVLRTPAWTDEGPLACNSCHGEPPAEHPGEDCENCHVAVSSGPGVLVNKDLHLNLEVNFAATETECTTCHGAGEDPAPPVDLDGNDQATLMTVGAHQSHLNPRFGMAVPVACSECHLVPDVVSAEGHLDSSRPAEVFPDFAGVGTLASADGAMPTYDPEAGTCANNYCHGGGESLSEDTSPGKVQVLDWAAPFQGVYCGSCHGIPPEIAPHSPMMGLTQCTQCHNATVDQNGTILFEEVDGELTSRHINGEVDVVFQ